MMIDLMKQECVKSKLLSEGQRSFCAPGALKRWCRRSPRLLIGSFLSRQSLRIRQAPITWPPSVRKQPARASATSLEQNMYSVAVPVVNQPLNYRHMPTVREQLAKNAVFKLKRKSMDVAYTFKSLHDLAQDFIADILIPYQPPCSLWSSGRGLLSLLESGMKTRGTEHRGQKALEWKTFSKGIFLI